MKRFGKSEALRGVDPEIPRAKVLGVLGPNGAGKTTAVRILTTLLKPDAGRALIDGVDVVAEPRRARARIGLTGQYAAVDERLTGFENLEHVGRLFHLGVAEAKRRAQQMLERFSLEHAAGRVVGGYSGGMRRRLDIAMSLIARPSVLFLDEPTTGLDPRSRQEVWDLIDELVQSGTTTLLTTQYLDEADRLADEIAVIDKGLVIARGTAAELKRQTGGDQVEVVLEDPADAPRTMELLACHGCDAPHLDGSPDGRVVVLPVIDLTGMVPTVVRQLDEEHIKVRDVGVRHSTLDDVFFALTGHAAEETEDDEEPRDDQDGRDGQDGRADRAPVGAGARAGGGAGSGDPPGSENEGRAR